MPSAKNSLTLITPVLPGKADLLAPLTEDINSLVAANNEWEIDWQVIFDGPASDQELQLVAEFSVHQLDSRGGPAKARNYGLAASDADWIYPIDADDRLDLGNISYFLSALSRTSADWLGTNRSFIDRQEIKFFSTTRNMNLAPGDFIARHQCQEKTPHCNSIAWRRHFLAGLDGWPEIKYHEDLALALLYTDRYPGFWLSKSITLFRVWEDSLTASADFAARRQETFRQCFRILNQDRRRRKKETIKQPKSNHEIFELEYRRWLSKELEANNYLTEQGPKP